eukprot:1795448-Prorocentrum_lima.AAC.1
MTSSLVGSEMCIRDRISPGLSGELSEELFGAPRGPPGLSEALRRDPRTCLLYTSDAADDM